MTAVNEQAVTSSTDKEKEDKSVALMVNSVEGEETVTWVPFGVTSFADFDVMEEAQKQALAVKNDASLFKALVDNILNLDPDQGDKSAMIVALANEFAQRVQQPAEEKETTEETDHYKEVSQDALKATDDDFKGGCPYCRFGEVDKLKGIAKCPYCQNDLEVTK